MFEDGYDLFYYIERALTGRGGLPYLYLHKTRFILTENVPPININNFHLIELFEHDINFLHIPNMPRNDEYLHLETAIEMPNIFSYNGTFNHRCIDLKAPDIKTLDYIVNIITLEVL